MGMRVVWLAVALVGTAAAAAPHTVAKHRAVVRPRPAAPPATITPVAPAPAVRWLDDAEALMTRIDAGAAPVAFGNGTDPLYAWSFPDGALVVAEELGPDDSRFYFYRADMTAPFLVRDRLYQFGFADGRLAALLGQDGAVQRTPLNEWQARTAVDLYARGRQLWFAAQLPPPPPPVERAVNVWHVSLDLGGHDDRRHDRRRSHADRHDRGPRGRTQETAGGQRPHGPPSRGPAAAPGNSGGTVVGIAPVERPRRERGRPAVPPVVAVAPPLPTAPIATAPPEAMPADVPPAEPTRRERGRPTVEPVTVAVAPPLAAAPVAAAPAPEPVQAAPPPAPAPEPVPPAPEPAPPAAAPEPAPAPPAREGRALETDLAVAPD